MDDPLLSQDEIDALLRSMTEDAPAAVSKDAPAEPSGPPAPLEAPRPRSPSSLPPGIHMLLDVDVTCRVDLGDVEMDFGELLSLRRSSLVVLESKLSDPSVLYVNGVPFAYGTIVETDGRYGLRISALARPQEEAHAS